MKSWCFWWNRKRSFPDWLPPHVLIIESIPRNFRCFPDIFRYLSLIISDISWFFFHMCLGHSLLIHVPISNNIGYSYKYWIFQHIFFKKNIEYSIAWDNPILVGGLEHEWITFPFSWEFHHPNWKTPSFFRGVGQPPTSIISSYKHHNHISYIMYHNHYPIFSNIPTITKPY